MGGTSPPRELRCPDRTEARFLVEPTAPVSPPKPLSKPWPQQGKFLTRFKGGALGTNDRSLKIGPRDPVVLQDHHLRGKTGVCPCSRGANPLGDDAGVGQVWEAAAFAVSTTASMSDDSRAGCLCHPLAMTKSTIMSCC